MCLGLKTEALHLSDSKSNLYEQSSLMLDRRNMLIQSMKKELLHMPCFDHLSSQTLTVIGTTIRFIYCCHGGIYEMMYQ